MQSNDLSGVRNHECDDRREILRHEIEEGLREEILDDALNGTVVAAMIVEKPAGVPEEGIDEQDEEVEGDARPVQDGQREMKDMNVDDQAGDEGEDDVHEDDEDEEEVLDEEEETEEVEAQAESNEMDVLPEKVSEENLFVDAVPLDGYQGELRLVLVVVHVRVEMHESLSIVLNRNEDFESRFG